MCSKVTKCICLKRTGLEYGELCIEQTIETSTLVVYLADRLPEVIFKCLVIIFAGLCIMTKFNQPAI